MKNHILKIKYFEPGFASMQIEADSLEELQASIETFLSRQESITWDSSPENALHSRLVSDMQSEEQRVEYAHSSVIFFEQEDITSQNAIAAQKVVLEQEEAALLSRLAATDYLVIRLAETGVDFDQAIKDERSSARVRISEIRVDISLL